MSEINDEFIKAFERLKAEINKRAGEPTAFEFKLDRAASRDRFVERNRVRLRYIREVRDLLQHPKNDAPGRPFAISTAFLQETRDLLKRLTNPPAASDIWVPLPSLMLARQTDRIGDLAAIMKEKGFSHLPILDSAGTVIGVFNEAAVFAHLWKENETLIERNMTVADVMDSCDLLARHTETFEFVRPTKSQDELAELFVNLPTPTTRIGAVFVTASGKRTERLQGLITPWDVLAQITGV